MIKISEFCKVYNLEIRVRCESLGDCIIYTFHNYEAMKGYSRAISMTDLDKMLCLNSLENFIFEEVIDKMSLDKDLWKY